MWKKEEAPDPVITPRQEPAAGRPDRVSPAREPSERTATIGRSISINGEVSGDEDLVIQGRVDGSVNLKQHSVTVGPEGEVKAHITARVVTVEGSVEGNLNAEEQVILRSSAVVEGDIVAPRVVLEDGARFRGGVDMGEIRERSRSAGAAAQTGVTETRRTPSGVDVAGEMESGTSNDKAKNVPQTAARVSR